MPLTAPPLISVIMPCFNGESFIASAVESVLEQTYPNIELIVVDDGSTDSSLSVLAGYGDRICVIEQYNAGPYPARNKGVQASKGEYLAFLDADDYWTKDCLEQLYDVLHKEPDAALAYCGWQNIGRRSSEPYIPPDFETPKKTEFMLEAASRWPIHGALIRRRAFDAVGGFRDYMRTCMDYDLWLRMTIDRLIVRVDKVLAYYRHHDKGQITSTQWRQAINVWNIKRKFVRERPDLVADISKIRLSQLIDGALLQRGYENYWRRDTVSAQKIFRTIFFAWSWSTKDLRYLLPATILPHFMYDRLVRLADKRG